MKTLDVRAGTTINFNARASISHPGSLNVYMAKASDGTPISQFDGSGAVWMKIMHAGPDISPAGLKWPYEGAASVPIQLPACLEDGEYLLRIEHIALHGASGVGGAQLYISCAQVRVSGGTGGIKAPRMLSFPGSYEATDPGLMINIYCESLVVWLGCVDVARLMSGRPGSYVLHRSGGRGRYLLSEQVRGMVEVYGTGSSSLMGSMRRQARCPPQDRTRAGRVH